MSTVRLSLDIPAETATALATIAAETGVSRAEMVRRLLRLDVAAWRMATEAHRLAAEKPEKLGEPLDEEEPAVVAFPSERKRNLMLWKRLRADRERLERDVEPGPEGAA